MEVLFNNKKVHFINHQGGVTDSDVLLDLSNYAFENDMVYESHASALIDRENLYPTGIMTSIGVAIPHAEIEHTKNSGIIIARLEKPVLFKEMVTKEKIEVEVLFMLLVKETKDHMQLLEKVVTFIQSSEYLEILKTSAASDLIIEEFSKLYND